VVRGKPVNIDAITIAVLALIINVLIVPFVGFVLRSSKALEAKQIADNAARKEEITSLGHKMELAAVTAKAGQEVIHRDNSDMKAKLDRLENLLSPLIERLGLHVPASESHR
jgi:hypothetical protein